MESNIIEKQREDFTYWFAELKKKIDKIESDVNRNFDYIDGLDDVVFEMKEDIRLLKAIVIRLLE